VSDRARIVTLCVLFWTHPFSCGEAEFLDNVSSPGTVILVPGAIKDRRQWYNNKPKPRGSHFTSPILDIVSTARGTTSKYVNASNQAIRLSNIHNI